MSKGTLDCESIKDENILRMIGYSLYVEDQHLVGIVYKDLVPIIVADEKAKEKRMNYLYL